MKAEYRYDTRNLRTKKVVYDGTGNVAETVNYRYDDTGLLIGEGDGQGHAQREYVYLDGTPLAQIDVAGQQETITYLHTDHLATPRLATGANQTVVWAWESDAYGMTAPTGNLTVNLRFPGQYFDAESGLHYNWNRYYDPGTGRYLTSDPVGLESGINSFIYGNANPLNLVDLDGLNPHSTRGGDDPDFKDPKAGIAKIDEALKNPNLSQTERSDLIRKKKELSRKKAKKHSTTELVAIVSLMRQRQWRLFS